MFFILSKSKMRRSKFITDFQILHQTLAGSLTPKNSWQASVQNHQLVLVMFSLYSPKYDMKPTKNGGFNNLKSSSTSETIFPSLCNLFQRICHYNLSRFQFMQALRPSCTSCDIWDIQPIPHQPAATAAPAKTGSVQ